ncbi:MAG: hypothetical protein WBH38_01120 [Defluviitoga tunisiensis]
MIVSYSEALENPSPEIQNKLHQTGDVYTTGLAKHTTGLAASLDGINWELKVKYYMFRKMDGINIKQ